MGKLLYGANSLIKDDGGYVQKSELWDLADCGRQWKGPSETRIYFAQLTTYGKHVDGHLIYKRFHLLGWEWAKWEGLVLAEPREWQHGETWTLIDTGGNC